MSSLTSKLARDEDNRSFQQNGGEKHDDVVGSQHLQENADVHVFHGAVARLMHLHQEGLINID